ncbi:Proline iminopeptidase [Galdieria sulphuraria]|nr:Proline iminopeptidase [Galdieria sulphuraria]
MFQVPLDYSNQLKGTIPLFVRVVSLETVTPGTTRNTCSKVVCYLQGGPGMESPRPDSSTHFLRPLLDYFDTIVLLEQRGTGLSFPIHWQVLETYSSDVKEQAKFLACFRADSIVRDAEYCRKLLYGDSTWSILGQSFGGFCAVTYLSLFPHSLHSCYITAGLPPIFPGFQDIPLVRNIVQYLDQHAPVKLSSGSILTPRGLQTLGHRTLGFSGGFGSLHCLLEKAFTQDHKGNSILSEYFLATVDHLFSTWETNPLYAVLHESIYWNGNNSGQDEENEDDDHPIWAAEQVIRSLPCFDAMHCLQYTQKPIYFTGEMIFPFMFEQFACLRPYAKVVDQLARKKNWSSLYNKEQLQNNQIATAAAIFYNDVYVDYHKSIETAKQIAHCSIWVTNEYLHGALREDTKRVVGMLQKLLFHRSSCLEL